MRKYSVNEKYFDDLTEDSAYWLGFLYADGYVRLKDGKSGEMKIKLKNTDKDHLEKFKNQIESSNPIKCGVNKDDGSKFCYMMVNSTHIVKKLFDLGCLENKTFKIRLPILNENLMSHFIRGYFDGDGCIHKVKNRPNSFTVSICSNKMFVRDIFEHLKMGKIYEEKNHSLLIINKISEIKKFKEIIYKNSNVCLERKFHIFNEINYSYKRDYSLTKNKKIYKLITPQGNVMIVDHLKNFCNQHKLTYSTMSNLSRGIGSTNKGWKCILLKK